MKKLVSLFVVLTLIASFAISSGAEINTTSFSQAISEMSVLSSHDFEAEDVETEVSDTAFEDDWDVTLGTGNALIYEYNGSKALMSSGSAITANGTISYELSDVIFGEGDAYAVSIKSTIPASGANSVGHLYLRGSEIMERDGNPMNWYDNDRSGGSFRGASGIGIRWQASNVIEVSIRFYDEDSNTHVNTAYARIKSTGFPYGETHTISAVDDGEGTIVIFLNDAKYASVKYSNAVKYEEDDFDTNQETYYSNVTVFDSADEQVTLTYINATDKSNVKVDSITTGLVAKEGRVAIANAGRQVYYDEITVYEKVETEPTPTPTPVPTTAPTATPTVAPTSAPTQEPTTAPIEPEDPETSDGMYFIILALTVGVIISGLVIYNKKVKN